MSATIRPEKLPHIRVEYDIDYFGGDYAKIGKFAFIPEALCPAVYNTVEEAFEACTGIPRQHVIHYSSDERFFPDGTEWMEQPSLPITSARESNTATSTTTTKGQKMSHELDNNALGLARAMDDEGHCRPGSVIVRDGSHSGTLFTWIEGRWIVYDLENGQPRGERDRIAVVSIEPDGDQDQAERGLNQLCLACDLETPRGEWVVDAEDLPELREQYGANLVVLWEQGGPDRSEYGDLHDYHSGEYLRPATQDERDESRAAGPEGVILIGAGGELMRADDRGSDDARRCYVQE